MGYIDDKAREADNTIKGIGIIVVVVIALIAIFGSIEGGIGAFAVIMSLAFVGCIIWLVHVVRKENRQNREAALAKQKEVERAADERQEQFELGKKRYNIRLQELHFDKTGKEIVYVKYNNSENYYKNYIWFEDGKEWEILAEPDMQTYWSNPDYTNLGNIKKLYIDPKGINYIAIEGNYCVLYNNWNPLYNRKDAIEIFRRFFPDKVK